MFSFLSEHIVNKHLGGKLLLSTKCESVLSIRTCDVSTIQPCNNYQNHATLSLHIAPAPGHGNTTAYVRTVDGDSLISWSLAYASSQHFESQSSGWVSEVGWHRNIPIHNICSYIGPSRHLSFPIVHAIQTKCATQHQLTRMRQEDCLDNTHRLFDKRTIQLHPCVS